MDSISQALWGALSSQATERKRRTRIPAWAIGLAAGTTPDLDSFIRSASDPLLATLMHRHFTHSIFFIPFGAALVWLCFWPWIRRERELYRQYYIYCFAGYGTHWILDVLTAYGTMIFWPFSNERYALDWLSIVDPLLTVPWLFALIVFGMTSKRLWIKAVLAYSLVYFSWSGLLHHRAKTEFTNLMVQQGVAPEKVRLLPTLANSFWYRAVAVVDEQIIAHGILVHPFTFDVYHREGTSRPRWSPPSDWSQSPELERQLRIWRWFVDDYMYLENESPVEIGDGRYSTVAADFESLWVLRVDPENPSLTRRTAPALARAQTERTAFEGYRLLLDQSDLKPLVATDSAN